MSGLEAARGVQVLSVEADGRYSSDAAALRRVAEAAAARALPVAVVSVAGATRGGKSFLLDFFLRYLRAPESARSSGAWLGEDDDPLTGFSWRGGWQSNTQGILLWSEPIIVTHEVDGQTKKIAVLLMDTQGTFDSTSTVKDCTTIFAMSTLMSSLQIYNLAQIIREDDLQHLQLFTEYGKLAREKDVTPFQGLMFRVRDWMFPYEHPYGAVGGENYLRTVLQAQTTKQEIIDLRKHIRSSFETVSCFLTPHPGMAVTDQNFNGRLCDLLPEFKESLLEFVPSILHPSKLIPKTINGHVITTADLPTYFRTYLEIFNSDTLPPPVSILQATSLACLETALRAAREEYTSRMDRAPGGATCMSRDSVPRRHAAAMEAARLIFVARRTLAAPPLVAAKLEALMQELDAKLATYVALNQAAIYTAVGAARGAYEAAVRAACGARPPCLHPRDAPVLHAAASSDAMAVFDDTGLPQDQHDPDRNEMLKWLDSKGLELQTSNDLNNTSARLSASALYTELTQRAARRAGGALVADQLRREHVAAKDAAVEALRGARNRASAYSDEEDCYYIELMRKIEEEFSQWESSNRRGCQNALRAALAEYSARMSRVWGPHACLHPRTLRREHDAARRAARDELRAETCSTDDSDEERRLNEELESRYDELVRMNEAGNEALVSAAYSEYCRRMDVRGAPSLTSVFIVTWLMKVLVQLPQDHGRARAEACDYFRARRRCDDDDDDNDEYFDRLKTKLREGYNVYCNPMHALALELNVPINN